MKINRSVALLPVALLLVGVLAACEDSGTDPTPTKTAVTTPSPRSSALDDLQDKLDEASKSAEAAVPEAATVPNVVGMTNAEAIPALHKAGFMANEEDATGQNRWSVDNSNWRVCRQDPEAGATDVLRVAIYSVKLDESC